MVGSFFSTVYTETQQVICNLFNAGSQVKVTMKPFHKQVGGLDCGVFATAANIDPSAVKFKQQDMQPLALKIKNSFYFWTKTNNTTIEQLHQFNSIVCTHTFLKKSSCDFKIPKIPTYLKPFS